MRCNFSVKYPSFQLRNVKLVSRDLDGRDLNVLICCVRNSKKKFLTERLQLLSFSNKNYRAVWCGGVWAGTAFVWTFCGKMTMN